MCVGVCVICDGVCVVPELQGEPEDIAREKCKLAANNVRSIIISIIEPNIGNFRMVEILNIRTAQDSDVEHIVQGNFQFSDDALQYENFHHTKLPAIRLLLLDPT